MSRARLATLFALVPLGLALTFAGVFPRDACSYGCSRVEDAVAFPGSCWYSEGSACYECYYSEAAGFKTCFESPDGSDIYCTDYRQVPF